MSGKEDNYRGPVFFCYANPTGFSGQKEATELVMRGLAARGWDCRQLPQPVFERERGGVGALASFASGLLTAWTRALRMLVTPRGTLAVNLGLTKMAFLRDSVPLFVGRLAYGRARVLISLHGSLFMTWPNGSLNARLFRTLLRQAGTVTVLGERQRARLLALGLPADRIEIVINSCTLAPLSESLLRGKLGPTLGRPLRVLHLSSLIATKGFPEYLEALALLAKQNGPRIEAVLCGRLTASEFQDRFPNAEAAERWIEEKVAAINRGNRVLVCWVRGAAGRAKEELFRAADVFLLPTRYAVEAQPIVLLEAMASGCAVVTTKVGEIPTILDEASALLLESGSPQELAAALEELGSSPDTIARLATAGHRRFCEQYAMKRHLDGWETRFAAGAAGARLAPAPALAKS